MIWSKVGQWVIRGFLCNGHLWVNPPTPDVVFFPISPGLKLRQDRITNKKMSRVSDSSSLT